MLKSSHNWNHSQRNFIETALVSNEWNTFEFNEICVQYKSCQNKSTQLILWHVELKCIWILILTSEFFSHSNILTFFHDQKMRFYIRIKEFVEKEFLAILLRKGNLLGKFPIHITIIVFDHCEYFRSAKFNLTHCYVTHKSMIRNLFSTIC